MSDTKPDCNPDRVPVLAIVVIGLISILALLLVGYGMLNNQRVPDMALLITVASNGAAALAGALTIGRALGKSEKGVGPVDTGGGALNVTTATDPPATTPAESSAS